MVICVGAVSAGKSFLLSALCDPSFEKDSYIVPTVGVNIFTLNIDSRACATIRELGGALCAVWSSYIASETRLIFVIDSSDIASIALVATKLTECVALLEDNSAQENKVGRLCIVWTKLDRSASQVFCHVLDVIASLAPNPVVAQSPTHPALLALSVTKID